MKYLIAVKTMPDHSLDEPAILSLRAEAQAAMPGVEVWRASVEDPLEEAFIDSQTLNDEITDQKLDLQDFITYCERRRVDDAYAKNGSIAPTSAQSFFISLWGQGVFVVAFPLDEVAARGAYARLIGFAKERLLQLMSLAPGGLVDLQQPDSLPPNWHNWFS